MTQEKVLKELLEICQWHDIGVTSVEVGMHDFIEVTTSTNTEESIFSNVVDSTLPVVKMRLVDDKIRTKVMFAETIGDEEFLFAVAKRLNTIALFMAEVRNKIK